MIYVDTSVAMAQLFAEDRRAPERIWAGEVVSSRLLEYEVWTRVNGRRAGGTHGETVRALLGRILLVELAPVVLARVLQPFPVPVRTLDAIHLATALYLTEARARVELATFDGRMCEAARALRIPLAF